ncbi:hypothetical protein ERW49_18825 [Aliivibrio finisterrensis]|uniref:Uncharacterized protein n=1 Tax=Aliivibrio finisterrensis TaxID=511998 RepID=A0A4Q5K843_9GAMM|nr:hypothetical protein ERW49_18825 [Aliivibrio finisterrensis]
MRYTSFNDTLRLVVALTLGLGNLLSLNGAAKKAATEWAAFFVPAIWVFHFSKSKDSITFIPSQRKRLPNLFLSYFELGNHSDK